MKHYTLGTAMALVLALPAFAQDKPGEGVTVRPVASPIAEELFQARVIYKGLEQLGYTIEPQQVEIQTAHLAVGTGDADFYTAHWDLLHAAFFTESGGEEVLQKVGPFIEGMVQGYLVDKASYDAGVKNLGDFKDPAIAAKFDGDGDGKADLAGCVPGWGCERIIEHHMDEYGLRDTVTHNQGEYNALMADTIARKETGNPILYFTWTPYWVSGALVPGKDVEWLDVPYTSLPDGVVAETTFNGKNLGFAVDNMYILATDKFLAENPAAAKILESVKIDINDISAQNKLMSDGAASSEDIDKHVADWIAAHQAEFDGWVAAAADAAK
ncbi:glycine betaine/L-proline ABC transporter substrate-binding protein ProX [Tabrizicola sp.]|uniref:glycine betaine/L-proline ABC transporter substrate-binding protein ProX n=1 Tax=Tabrizicola sp. TaxID=2005166 RepID=UPI002736E3CB|nr:glycine betaine/L-proline ABC transporter substrate-binding protein ProX [Tabrizicola sp.]MDP3195389.1 glycine betaine/L-proline ABC transporter substrate-binding protein ProX [Tabrizicola sp.]